MRGIACIVAIITLGLIGIVFSVKAVGKTYSPEYMKQVHQTFKEYGCNGCHAFSVEGMAYTKAGDEAGDKGYGCIGLQTIVIMAWEEDISGPGIQTAKKAFEAQQCVGCHDVKGIGSKRQNLNTHGLVMFKQKLGCTSMVTALIDKFKKN